MGVFRILIVTLSLALALGTVMHAAAAGGMKPMVAANRMGTDAAMGDCDACTGKTMKSGAPCDLACNPPVAIAVEAPDRLDIDLASIDYGATRAVRGSARVLAVNLSPPRTFTLI